MRSAWAIAALLVALAPARADDTKPSYRAVIDRVDFEPASIGGTRLRIYLSALTLQGQLIDLWEPKSLKLVLGGSERKAPYSLGVYGATKDDTAIVVVAEASQDYNDVLRVISDTIDASVLAELPERTQVALLPYGETPGNAKLAPVKQTRGKLGTLSSDGSSGEPAMLDALDRALGMLKKLKAEPEGRPIRKMIVLIGDGRDRSGDHERVTRLGKRALREGVRIHSLAFSPADQRRPLLALGELSKQSLGTFRWVRGKGPESWTPAFQQLRDEIAKQYVVTYFLDAEDDAAGKKVKIQAVGRVEARSNEAKVPAASCSGEPCETGYCADDHCNVPASSEGRGAMGWVVLVGGIAAAVLVVLGVIGYFMSRKQVAKPAPLTGAQPAVAPPVATGAHVAAPVAPAPVVTGPSLLVMTGPRSGERIGLRHGFLIGKAPGCDLMIDDGYTSSHHAQIGMDQFGNCSLYDRGSTNGTFVNGVRVGECVLSHGVSLRIGSTEFRFLAQ
jgi:hypothetical protein